jgi:hypothetical protein
MEPTNTKFSDMPFLEIGNENKRSWRHTSYEQVTGGDNQEKESYVKCREPLSCTRILQVFCALQKNLRWFSLFV